MGKFEKYINVLTSDHLSRVVSSEQVDSFLSAKSLTEQRQIFDNWSTDKLKEVYW